VETRTNVLKAARVGNRTGEFCTESPNRGSPVVHPGGTRRALSVISLKNAARLTTVTGVLLATVAMAFSSSAFAAEATVGLGTSGAYSVLGSQTVTNTGPSTLSGDLGVSPGTAITGFPPGKALGSTQAGNAQAAKARADLVTGYNDAAGRAKTASVAGDLVGKNLTSGVYNSSGPIALSGTLTLNGQGNPDAVFIFQAASTLITASSSKVSLVNDAQACNVFWQVGSSATLGTGSSFDGTIMALQSITVTTGTVVVGRALARNGAVTLDDDTFLDPACKTSTPPTTTTTTKTTPTTTSPTTTTSTTTTPTSTTPTTTRGTTVTGGQGPGTPGGVAGSGGVPTGTGGVAPGGSVGRGRAPLAQTGAGPMLWMVFFGGILLILLGGLVLAFSRPRSPVQFTGIR
jgi:hypothetical protein